MLEKIRQNMDIAKFTRLFFASSKQSKKHLKKTNYWRRGSIIVSWNVSNKMTNMKCHLFHIHAPNLLKPQKEETKVTNKMLTLLATLTKMRKQGVF
jgi:hypothetical protein